MSQMGTRRRLLITGGAGAIGTGFAEWAQDRYDLRLLDLPGRFSDDHANLGETVSADLQDATAVRAAATDVDTIVHLGGQRSPSALWSDLLPNNIVGTYNVVAAAIAAGCRRVVYASSVHAVMGHPDGLQVRESDAVHPADLYGVTKCFGEALGSYAATTEGISFVALRIGAFQEATRLQEPESGWMLRDFCEPHDLYRLIHRVIEVEDITFEIYNAVSANTVSRLSMEKARGDLGFEPEADSLRFHDLFRRAFESVGGLTDKGAESGMREDVARLIGGPER